LRPSRQSRDAMNRVEFILMYIGTIPRKIMNNLILSWQMYKKNRMNLYLNFIS